MKGVLFFLRNIVILISPHPDDIALLLGYAIMKYLNCCEFYIMGWKKYNKLSLDLTNTVDRVRQEEYDTWRHCGVQLIYDNYEDAYMRMGYGVSQLLGDTVVELDVLKRDEKLVLDLVMVQKEAFPHLVQDGYLRPINLSTLVLQPLGCKLMTTIQAEIFFITIYIFTVTMK